MKYIVVLCDGMADYPLTELGNKTPVQYARTPYIDMLAKKSLLGTVKTVPEGMNPGSDTANLSVMGYNPEEFYTGRSPFEAVSMGIDIEGCDMTLRCNLVTLTEEENYFDKVITDHSSDEISSKEGKILIDAVNKAFEGRGIEFYPGVSYRNLAVIRKCNDEFKLTPPHDILGRKIDDYLYRTPANNKLIDIMKESFDILNNHEVNVKRREKGLKPANSLWFWGEGRKPGVPSFKEKYGIDGSVISAVDLIKGIGICAGFKVIEVEGATGNVHTNFKGKAEAAYNELKSGQDFVFVHLEAPDEAGHRSEIENKVKSAEEIDEKIIGYLYDKLIADGESFKLMVLPDHPTPIVLRTHTGEPVPYMIYDSSSDISDENAVFDEFYPAEKGTYIENGHKLMDLFIKGKI